VNRAIFISDVHLGTDESRVEALCDFLSTAEAEYLYIVGDFVDFYHLYEHHGWSKKCNKVIRKILGLVKKDTKIRICVGNHDAFLGMLAGFKFGNIAIAHSFVHSGKFVNHLVTHGDRYDKSLGMTARLLSFAQTHFWWLPMFGRIRNAVYKQCSRAVATDKLLEEATQNGAQSVIFGHTHDPKIDGLVMNCGDWVANCTALIEQEDGEFRIHRAMPENQA
jgi:UDP-2,3-diacylglucosamine pyrophosphatase LpxH